MGKPLRVFVLGVLACAAAACPATTDHTTNSGNGAGTQTREGSVCETAYLVLDDPDALMLALEECRELAEPGEDRTSSSAEFALLEARAALGAGDPELALRSLDRAEASPDSAEISREQLCWYRNWAATQAGRYEWVASLECALADIDVVALSSADATSMRLAYYVARRQIDPEPVVEALERLRAVLEGEMDEPTEAFVYVEAAQLGESLTPVELDSLRNRGDVLSRVVVVYRDALDAVASDAPDVAGRLAAAQDILSSVGVEGLLASVQVAGESPALGDPIFGCVLELQGAYRQPARAALAGLLLAENVFEPNLSSYSRILIADAGDTPASAAAAVATLDAAGVLAIVGPIRPELVAAAVQEAERRGIPMLALLNDRSVTEGRVWSFAFFADPAAEGTLLAERASEAGLIDIAIAVPIPTPPYMDALVSAFRARAEALGVLVRTPMAYLTDDLQAEAEALASALDGTSFEALLIADTGDNATTLAAYLAAENIWSVSPGETLPGGRRGVVYLGNSFWHNPDFLLSGPDYLAGGVFPAWLPLETNRETTARFAQRFEAVFGRRPGLLDAFAHDALGLLRYVVFELGARSRAQVREAMASVGGIAGATGELRFNPDRTHRGRPVLLQVTRDGFRPY